MDGARFPGKLGAGPTGDSNARHGLTHGMAERAHAASAMRKLQFFGAKLVTPSLRERQCSVEGLRMLPSVSRVFARRALGMARRSPGTMRMGPGQTQRSNAHLTCGQSTSAGCDAGPQAARRKGHVSFDASRQETSVVPSSAGSRGSSASVSTQLQFLAIDRLWPAGCTTPHTAPAWPADRRDCQPRRPARHP